MTPPTSVAEIREDVARAGMSRSVAIWLALRITDLPVGRLESEFGADIETLQETADRVDREQAERVWREIGARGRDAA
jgi:hypothetical protein